MKLSYKKPSKETIIAMTNTIQNSSKNENSYLKEVEDKITSYTNHQYGKVVNSGNGAILIAMNGINGPIIVPDQGSWHGFKQIAKFLNKDLITLKTNLGLINKEILDDFIINNPNIFDNYNNKNNNNPAIFLTSFAGYTAEQPIKEISAWCKEHDILLVEDVSGSIGDPKKKLANGRYSDIIVCSTNSPKIVNVGDGGFITTNNNEIFEKSKLLLKICKSNNITNKGIFTEMDFAEDNLKKTIEKTKYVKDNLDNVIHDKKRGTNVIVRFENPKSIIKNLKNDLIVEGKSMVTLCPNYNRLKEKAIAIEIKNLAIESLSKENLDGIIEIIKKY